MSLSPAAISRTAALLGAARLAAQPVPDVPAADTPATIDDGYAVQAALHDFLAAAGQGETAGWKVGATTAGMQTYLGVEGPAFGRMMSANRLQAGSPVSPGGFCNPGIECEIAVRIGADAADTPYTRDSVGGIVDAVLPAIEIVENRYGDFLRRGTPLLIADDFFHKAFVPGAEVSDWQGIDLAAVRGRSLVDGVERGAGSGADVMGHPFEAVAWLANALAARGHRLAAGQTVLTGSVAPVVWLETFPCDVAIELSGLGAVSLRFG